MTTASITDITGLNTLLIAIVSGLVGWAFQDLRKRVSGLERKSSAILGVMFHWALNDPKIPEAAKNALIKAMER